jgi:hypothetical protein
MNYKSREVAVEDERIEADRAEFKSIVETAFGQDTMRSIGPVTFEHKAQHQSMTFKLGSRRFRLERETGALARLLVFDHSQFSYRPLGLSLNLNHKGALNVFVETLRTAKFGNR